MNTMQSFMSGFDTSLAAWELAKEMVIDQNVYINADFSGVSNKQEIEEAFEDLINLAT
jgi:hypothetical protein